MERHPEMTDLFGWLALMRAPGLGLRQAHALLERFGSPAALLDAPASELARNRIPEPAREWFRAPDRDAIDRDLEWLAGDHHHLVRWGDTDYPSLLAGIDDPPLALFVAGDPAVLDSPALAIVGSRNPTSAGRENAEAFGTFLANCGLTIVSGLALGIDAAAHRGAMRAGRTIAVCGTGLDEVYPSRHRRLAAAIADNGAVISEFPCGTASRPENFPRRNRIISGLAVGTLVVEAAIRSGSLITARLASEQGREVFAIPGSIHNPLAKGCHQLIRQGAKLVDSAEHIIEELGPLLGLDTVEAERPRRESDASNDEPSLDKEYEKLLECLEDSPVHIDQLVIRSGLTPDAVSSMLLIMELRGIVESAPGGRYARRQTRT